MFILFIYFSTQNLIGFIIDLFINISDSENVLNGNTPTPIASQKAFNIIADSLRRIDVSLSHHQSNPFQTLFAVFFHCYRLCLRSMLLHRQSISKTNFNFSSVFSFFSTHFMLLVIFFLFAHFITFILFKFPIPILCFIRKKPFSFRFL